MSAVLQMWQDAAADLGFVVRGPVGIDFKGGTLDVPVVVEGFGAGRGMVIVTSYSGVKRHTDALLEAGFGYSVMSQPRPNEAYDRESYIEMLSDWGWSGVPEDRPSWIVSGGD
jgi:hypothetical protein